MADIGLDDLLKLITTTDKGTDISTATFAADGDIVGARVKTLRQAANDTANVNAAGEFMGKRSKTGALDISSRMESFQSLKDDIEALRKESGAGRGIRAMERMSEQERNKLTKLGGNIFRDIEDGAVKHNAVIKALQDQRGKIEEKVRRDWASKWNGLQAKMAGVKDDTARAKLMGEIETLKGNKEAVMEKIADHFEELARPHQECLEEFNRIASEVETHTGLSRANFMKNQHLLVDATRGVNGEVKAISEVIDKEAAKLGVMTEQAYNDSSFLGKMFGRMKANMNISGELTRDAETGMIMAKESSLLGKGMKVGGAAAGAVLMGYGLKDLGQSVGFVSPDVDEQGKEVPADSGKLVKSVAELGAGAALAYFTLLHGGKVTGAHL